MPSKTQPITERLKSGLPNKLKPRLVMRLLLVVFLLNIISVFSYAQRVPNEAENIDYLITFGKDAPTGTGDDDHVQVFFFIVPKVSELPFYIRVYDPESSGSHDEADGPFNSKTKFTIYGGAGTFSEEARSTNPIAKYKSGNIMASKVFGQEAEYDSKWYTFGPFNPAEGEFVPELNGQIFKVIAEGVTGNDGNAYRYFLSMNATKNIPVDGANAFTYEYTFKLPLSKGVSHLYPFIDHSVISINQYNFDFDNDGQILLYSIVKNRHETKISGDNVWDNSKHEIVEEEKNTTIDLQVFKKDATANTMSMYVVNQYQKAVAFFSVPIGGPPKFKYDPSIIFKKSDKKN